MIITRTPLRISLFGGGTDLPSFFMNSGGGAVLSFTINKYVYVMVNRRFDDEIRVSYSETEIVDNVDDLKHNLIRECLKRAKIEKGVEVVTIADIPGRGTGLGSSSAVTVGVIKALGIVPQYGIRSNAVEVCKMAFDIENKFTSLGYQDAAAVCTGGCNLITFDYNQHKDEVKIGRLQSIYGDVLSRNLLLFFTGQTRQASTILNRQSANGNTKYLKRLKEHAHIGHSLLASEKFSDIGELLHETWEAKKQVIQGITTPDIDLMYNKAREAGALGGKICGAGGGGFLLVYCPHGTHEQVREALSDYKELEFNLTNKGCEIVESSERRREFGIE